MAPSIRILVVEDHDVARAGMAFLLGTRDGFEVVGEAEDGAAAVELTGRLRPDVIVMDYDMPKMNGVEATRRIAATFPEARVVGHSWHDTEPHAKAMLEAGAVAFISKGSDVSNLIHAIQNAHRKGDGKQFAVPNPRA